MNSPANYSYLPQNSAELERALLGAMLNSAASLRDALGLLPEGEQAFYYLPHRAIYKAMQRLHADNISVDMTTLMQRLHADGKLDFVGGSAYVKELLRHAPYGAVMEDYCHFMHLLWGKRQIAERLQGVVQGAHNPTTDLDELLTEAYTTITQIQQGLQVKGPVVLGELLDEVAADIEHAALTPGGLTGVPSGLKSIDAVTGGWQPSDLIIIAARPGMGKTSFALAQAVPASLAGYPGAFFNLEMNNKQMVRKTMATELREYSTSQLQRGYFRGGVDEARTIPDRTARLRDAEVYLDDTANLSISQFRSKAARLKADHDIRWIMVDYLQLMSADGKGNREQEIGAISRGLKLTAKELNIPVIAMSQLSRAVETRGGEKKPQLSDLRESGSIEQDADVVVFLYRPEYYDVKQDGEGASVENTTDVIFAKHRNGPLTEVTVGSTMMNGRYFDLEDDTPAPPFTPPADEQYGPRIVGQALRTSVPSEFSDAGEPVY